MILFGFLAAGTIFASASGQGTIINLNPLVTKTKFKLPSLPSRDTVVQATFTIVAPDDRRVLLRCENEGQVVECTEGNLQVINGLPKGFLCSRNLSTVQTKILLSIINYHQVSNQTTCEAYSIAGLSAPSESDEETNDDSATKATRRTTCDCGWTNQRRIVGGTATRMNEFPHMCGVIHKSTKSRMCGGSIISDEFILTAAHCVDDMTPNELEVIVGDYDMKGRIRTNSEQTIGVAKIIQHERWDTKRIVNDIALIRTKDKIKFSREVGPVCLPAGRTSMLGKTVTATGWGLTKTIFEKDRGLLRKVDLSVVDMPSCSASYGNTLNVRQPTQICTYARKKDTCQGDSGGPLVWLDPEINRYTQVALVSYGKKCGSESPAVNTDVSAYTDWIRLNVRRLSSGKQLCSKI